MVIRRTIRHSIIMLCLIVVIYPSSNIKASDLYSLTTAAETLDSLYIYKDTLTAHQDSILIKESKSKKQPRINDKPHSVTKAVLMSTFVPGLGQIYNKKAWKIPIIYVGFGASIYFIVSNNGQAKKCTTAIDLLNSGDQSAIAENSLASKYNVNQLINLRKQYQKDMQIAAIALGLIYVLNIIDATVDAYMFDYDISDKLTLKASPHVFFNPNATSITFKNMGVGLNFTMKF